MYEPLVPMFSLYLAHTSAAQNFSIPTLLGRKCGQMAFTLVRPNLGFSPTKPRLWSDQTPKTVFRVF